MLITYVNNANYVNYFDNYYSDYVNELNYDLMIQKQLFAGALYNSCSKKFGNFKGNHQSGRIAIFRKVRK